MFCCSKKSKASKDKDLNPDNKAPATPKESLLKSKTVKTDNSNLAINGSKNKESSESILAIKNSQLKSSLPRSSTLRAGRTSIRGTFIKKTENAVLDDETTLQDLLTNPELVEHCDKFINHVGELEPDQRRLTELILIQILSNSKSQIYYYIEQDWITTYIRYLKTDTSPPGKMDHLYLSQRMLSQDEQLVKVNQYVWVFLSKLYGGEACPECEPNPEGGFTNMQRTYFQLSSAQPDTKSFLVCPPWVLKSITSEKGTKRRTGEQEMITHNIETQTKMYYFINKQWWSEYNAYLKGNSGSAPPVEISNPDMSETLNSSRLEELCYPINEIVWMVISKLYNVVNEPITAKKLKKEDLEDICVLEFNKWFETKIGKQNLDQKIEYFRENSPSFLKPEYNRRIVFPGNEAPAS